MSSSALITLLTDFGEQDWFVASMKGVILTINPQVRIVDLGHHIAAHDVEEAAYFLKSCYRHFPEGTIHVAVVDPGVGSARRPIIIKAKRFYFLAPDNGLLTHIFDEESGVEAREIENEQIRLTRQGATFDGRDLFAPAAAWLTKGRSFSAYGKVIRDPVKLACAIPHWENSVLVGQVVHIDRFGNLISNVTTKHLEEAKIKIGKGDLNFRIADHSTERLVLSYSEGSGERLSAIVNSSDCVELFLKEKNAAQILSIIRGQEMFVS